MDTPNSRRYSTIRRAKIDFPEPAYTVAPAGNAEYRTSMLRFSYASQVTPQSIYDFDMATRERVLKKRMPVLGGYDASQYVAERINAVKPDLLFVGLGAPKQEFWIERYAYLPAKVMMGIGGSFEFAAGYRKRAPMVWQKTGVEWLWRLCLEPRRLWRRYLIGNSIFIFLVVRQWWNQSLNPSSAEGVSPEAQPEN